MEGITPTYDITSRSGDGFGWGSQGIWLFAILALIWGGGGFFGNRGAYADGRSATVEDLNNSANFTRLESQVQGIGSNMQAGFTNLGNGICSLGYELAKNFGSLSKELSSCCCEVKQVALENRYLAAQNTAEINANVTAQIQKVLDRMADEKAAAQAQRISQLELQQALCGVVRYPNAMTYNAGYSPFCYNQCGCNNI
jgi:hypothetical protein